MASDIVKFVPITVTEADREFLDMLLWLKTIWEAENRQHRAALNKILQEIKP